MSPQHLAFESLIADLSSEFSQLKPEEVEDAIEPALGDVCESLDVDMAVLWQWSLDGGDVLVPTHSHPRIAGGAAAGTQGVEHFPWCLQQMCAGRMIAICSLDDLPLEAAIDRESAALVGIKSNLTLPLAVGGGAPIGALAFSTLLAERDWPELSVMRFKLVAQILAGVLERRRQGIWLQESERRLSLAADAAEAGLWSFDPVTSRFWGTERARLIFGGAEGEDVTMERLLEIAHADDRERVRAAFEQASRSEGALLLEFRIVDAEGGAVRWLATRGRAFPASSGGSRRLMGVSFDVTSSKLADEALLVSQNRLLAGAELTGLAFYEVDLVTRTAYWDERIHDLCGSHPVEMRDLEVLAFWLEHIHPDDRDHVVEQRERLHSGEVDRLAIEYRYLHPTRGVLWIQHLAGTSSRAADGRACTTYGVLRDFTQQKRAEEELRDLSRRLLHAHEDERARLARELHDDLTQRLAVLAVDVGRIEMATADDALMRSLRVIRQGLVSLSEDVHTLAYQLHPSVLREFGLAEALSIECERLGPRSPCELTVSVGDLPSRIDSGAALGLYRVAQEALNNVVRHSQASAASIRIDAKDGGLRLVVRDDGIGFDPLAPQRSLGLVSMRERVRLLGGKLDIESSPGSGTAVIARVPGPTSST